MGNISMIYFSLILVRKDFPFIPSLLIFFCSKNVLEIIFLFFLESREITRLETSGHPPPLSEASQGVLVGKYLAVFGGCAFIPQRTCFNALYTLHLG